LKIDKRGNGHGAKARIRPAELTKLRDLKMEKTNWIADGKRPHSEIAALATQAGISKRKLPNRSRKHGCSDTLSKALTYAVKA
jgi:hypothetical protein